MPKSQKENSNHNGVPDDSPLKRISQREKLVFERFYFELIELVCKKHFFKFLYLDLLNDKIKEKLLIKPNSNAF